VEIWASARKHGVADHAVRNTVRYIEQDYDSQIRLLLIGPDRAGCLLEVVVVTDEPIRIIHADRLRPSFYDYLR
jgi:hypothetical protein